MLKKIFSTLITSAIIVASPSVAYSHEHTEDTIETVSASTEIKQVSTNSEIKTAADTYFKDSQAYWLAQQQSSNLSTKITSAKIEYAAAENRVFNNSLKEKAQEVKHKDLTGLLLYLKRENMYEEKNTLEIFSAVIEGEDMSDYLYDKSSKEQLLANVEGQVISSSKKLEELKENTILAEETKVEKLVVLDETRRELKTSTENLTATKQKEFDSYLNLLEVREGVVEPNDLAENQVVIPYDTEVIMDNIKNISNGDVKHVDMLGEEYTENQCYDFTNGIISPDDEEITVAPLQDIQNASPGDLVYLKNDKNEITSFGEYVDDGWVISTSPNFGMGSYIRLQPNNMFIEDKESKDKEKFKLNVTCTIDTSMLQYSPSEYIDEKNSEDTNVIQLTGVVTSKTNKQMVVTPLYSDKVISYEGYTIEDAQEGDIVYKNDVLTEIKNTSTDNVSSKVVINNDGTIDEEVFEKKEQERTFWPLPNNKIYPNGFQPEESLCLYQDTFRLNCNAAYMLEELNKAYKKQFDVDIPIGNTYRDFEGQLYCTATKGNMCATPGHSNHGLGLAVDLSNNLSVYDTEEHNWMFENAENYGWILPTWAQKDGSKPEPWHWEFIW